METLHPILNGNGTKEAISIIDEGEITIPPRDSALGNHTPLRIYSNFPTLLIFWRRLDSLFLFETPDSFAKKKILHWGFADTIIRDIGRCVFKHQPPARSLPFPYGRYVKSVNLCFYTSLLRVDSSNEREIRERIRIDIIKFVRDFVSKHLRSSIVRFFWLRFFHFRPKRWLMNIKARLDHLVGLPYLFRVFASEYWWLVVFQVRTTPRRLPSYK